MNDKTPKQKLLEDLGLPHLSFSRRRAASTPEEGADRTVLWGIKSVREAIEKADRALGTTPEGRGKSRR
jgi:hypothetical protein